MSDTLYGVMTLLESDVPGLSLTNFQGTELEAAKLWIDGAASLNAQIIRWPGNWAGLQPDVPGSFDQSYIDFDIEILAYARSQGIEVIMQFGQTPAWARSEQSPDDLFVPPENPAQYALAAASLHKAYQAAGVDDVISAWEIWNEPNIQPFWKTADYRNPLPAGTEQGIDAAVDRDAAFAYVDLLNTSYSALKNIDPDVTVLGGALAGTDLPYLQWMLEAGARMDGLSVHPYTRNFDGVSNQAASATDDPTLPQYDAALAAAGLPLDLNERFSFEWGLLRIQEMLAADGQAELPLWITEVGWNITDPDDGDPNDELWAVPDAAEQARELNEALAVLDSLDNIAAVTFFQLYDSTDGDFGFLNPDGSPRPAGLALQDWIVQLEGGALPVDPEPFPTVNPQPDDGSGGEPELHPVPLEFMTGTAANDLLFGTAGNDTFENSPGRDTVVGSSGNDTVFGSAGEWERVVYGVEGGEREDYTVSRGGDGALIIENDHFGTDTLYDVDLIYFGDDPTGYTARDLLKKKPHFHEHKQEGGAIHGGKGRDFLTGTDRDDVVRARGDNDVVIASGGDDTIHGGADLDMLRIRDAHLTPDDFLVERNDDGSFSVISDALGHDMLYGVEAVWFDSGMGLVFVDDLL